MTDNIPRKSEESARGSLEIRCRLYYLAPPPPHIVVQTTLNLDWNTRPSVSIPHTGISSTTNYFHSPSRGYMILPGDDKPFVYAIHPHNVGSSLAGFPLQVFAASYTKALDDRRSNTTTEPLSPLQIYGRRPLTA